MRPSLVLLSIVLVYTAVAGFAGFQAKEIAQSKLGFVNALIVNTSH